MQIISSQIINYFLFFGFFSSFGVFSPHKNTFHHAKAESKPSKGVVIKFIALHELRKNKGKTTIEIKIKKKVNLILFNFRKGQ